MEKKLVITIERQYGSGGRMLGETLSDQLGIPYYCDDIISMSSQQSAVAERFFRMNDEKASRNAFFRKARNATDKPSVEGNITKPENLFRFESETIRSMAEESSCILIGHCSNFVLRAADFGPFESFYVYCDLSKQIKRVIDLEGIGVEEALKRIQTINRQRENYYKYYTGDNWDDLTLYDMMLNTTNLTIPQTAELVKCYLKLRGYDL